MVDDSAYAEWLELWTRFRSHRNHLTGVVEGVCGAIGSVGQIVVLGAGRCLDLDYARLLSCTGAARVVLVDLAPREDIASYLAFQIGEQVPPAVAEVMGDTDVLAPGLVGDLRRPHKGPSVVVAAGLLGDVLPGLCASEAITWRDAVFGLMIEVAGDGGGTVALLDVTNELSIPGLASLDSPSLSRALAAAVSGGAYVTGMNPVAALHAFARIAGDRAVPIAELSVTAPWIWPIATEAVLVTCIRFVGDRA